MRTNIALKRMLGNHLDIDSGVQKIKGMFFINKDNEKCIKLLFTKFWRFSAFSDRKLPLRGPCTTFTLEEPKKIFIYELQGMMLWAYEGPPEIRRFHIRIPQLIPLVLASSDPKLKKAKKVIQMAHGTQV